MATLKWTGYGNHYFGDKYDWSSKTVPGPSDAVIIGTGADALIGQFGTTASYTVVTLALAQGADVRIHKGSELNLTNGSGLGGINGEIAAYGTLAAGGTITGGTITSASHGIINLDSSSGFSARLEVDSAGLKLSGNMEVTLSSNGSEGTFRYDDHIEAASPGATLYNAGQSTIIGGGYLGGDQLALHNGAKAVVYGRDLYVDASTIINQGTMMCGGGGLGRYKAGLEIVGAKIVNTGGTLWGGGTDLVLESTTVYGGTLMSGGGGVIYNGDKGVVLDGRTHAITNHATVVDYGLLAIEGGFTNNGWFTFAAASKNTLQILANTTLGGVGYVQLGTSGTNLITATATGISLVNSDTISGGGSIGGYLNVNNQAKGLIEANYNGLALTLYSKGGSSITNTGTIEAVNGGALILQDTKVVGPAGTIGADLISSVSLVSATASGRVVNSGVINVQAGSTLQVSGTAENYGQIKLSSTSLGAELEILAPGATFSDYGLVSLSGPNSFVVGSLAGTTLTNANDTFSGTGTIGAGKLDLINEAGGTLNADQAVGALLVDPNTLTNQGLMEATGAAGLILQGASIGNAGGTILAAAGGKVVLQTATITGGSLSVAASGTLACATSSDISSASVTNHGTVSLTKGADLSLSTANLTGGAVTIAAGATLVSASATLSSVATFANQGMIKTTDGAGLTLSGETLNNTGGTVSVAGLASLLTLTGATITSGHVAIASGAYLLATTSSTLGSAAVTNQDVVGAYNGANFTLSADAIKNLGGLLIAGAGSQLTLQSTTITGSGALDSGLATDAGGTIVIGAGSVVQIQGGQSNVGVIDLAGVGALADLRVMGGGATLTGGGTVTLGGGTAFIRGTVATATLTNVDNTLSGVGLIGDNLMTLDNQSAGVIEAVGAGQLVVATKGEMMTNAGKMMAGAGATLAINTTTISNAGGTILAQSGGHVTLGDDEIIGGAVGSAGTGLVNVSVAGGEFDGAPGAVTLSGTVRVLSGANLILDGAIDNTGLLTTLAGATTADLIIGAGGATLSGGGSITLSNSAGSRIVGQASGDILDNIDNRISGAGDIGAGVMTLINGAGGVIVGNQSHSLTLDTGAKAITNAGIIENTGAGGTVVLSAVNNTGALVVAGGTLALAGAVTGAGSATISGGTLWTKGSFTENVTFSTTLGVFKLSGWAGYTGTVKGLSTTGSNSLDLAGFSATGAKATYSGTTTSGLLTVTNGAQTARIKLSGNYVGSTFTLSSDGAGGTKVVDPSGPATTLVQAMAALPSGAGSPSHGIQPHEPTWLLAPGH